MARDYAEIVRALRAKAADPVVPPAEAKALLDKAEELELAHPEQFIKETSPRTDDTTITGRDGSPMAYWTNEPVWFHWHYPPPAPPSEEKLRRNYEEAKRQTENLLKQQHLWNAYPDEDEDYVEEAYRWQDEGEEDEEPAGDG